MNVDIEELEPCRKKLRIEVPAEDVEKEKREIEDLYAAQASVPGFRKGKAPRDLVRRKFANKIAEQTRETLVPEYYRKAIKEQGIDPVAVLNLDEPQLEEGAPFVFEVTVDVPPEFEVPAYEGLELKDEQEEVTDDRVNETVDQLRRRFATYEEVSDRPVQQDDIVEVNYSAQCDGQPLETFAQEAKALGQAEGQWIQAGEDSFIPGLGEALIGMNAGDTKQVEVTFPEDFTIQALGGRTAQYEVTVSGIREQRMPEVDQDFLQRIGVSTEEELRGEMRNRLEETEQQRERSRRENALLEKLLEATELDAPKSQVDEEAREALYEISRERLSRGQSREDINADRENIWSEARGIAEQRVKLKHIMNAIADREDIEVSDREVQEHIAEMAVRQRQDAGELRKRLEKEERLDQVRDDVRFRKTIERIMEKTQVA